MTRRSPQLRQQQLYQAIQDYLQNLGLVENSFKGRKHSSVHKLELKVRSLNLQRLP